MVTGWFSLRGTIGLFEATRKRQIKQKNNFNNGHPFSCERFIGSQLHQRFPQGPKRGAHAKNDAHMNRNGNRARRAGDEHRDAKYAAVSRTGCLAHKVQRVAVPRLERSNDQRSAQPRWSIHKRRRHRRATGLTPKNTSTVTAKGSLCQIRLGCVILTPSETGDFQKRVLFPRFFAWHAWCYFTGSERRHGLVDVLSSSRVAGLGPFRNTLPGRSMERITQAFCMGCLPFVQETDSLSRLQRHARF